MTGCYAGSGWHIMCVCVWLTSELASLTFFSTDTITIMIMFTTVFYTNTEIYVVGENHTTGNIARFCFSYLE